RRRLPGPALPAALRDAAGVVVALSRRRRRHLRSAAAQGRRRRRWQDADQGHLRQGRGLHPAGAGQRLHRRRRRRVPVLLDQRLREGDGEVGYLPGTKQIATKVTKNTKETQGTLSVDRLTSWASWPSWLSLRFRP